MSLDRVYVVTEFRPPVDKIDVSYGLILVDRRVVPLLGEYRLGVSFPPNSLWLNGCMLYFSLFLRLWDLGFCNCSRNRLTLFANLASLGRFSRAKLSLSWRPGIWIIIIISPHVASLVVGAAWYRSRCSFFHEIISTRFLGAGGGELGDPFSTSLAILLEDVFDFLLFFGVDGGSSSWELLSPSLLCSFLWSAARHSSVEYLFHLWKVQYLFRSKVDDLFCGELFMA